MQIQVNTDRNIQGDEELRLQVEEVVKGSLRRFAERVTRVEVFLTDENSGAKTSHNDKRCVMEARLAGLQPITVSHRAESLRQAITGAGDKMARTLKRTIGRLGVS